MAIFKLVGCWEYQSCEHDSSYNRTPWRMMARIKELAEDKAGYGGSKDIYQSEIYDLAPWDYNKPEWQDFMDYLKKNV